MMRVLDLRDLHHASFLTDRLVIHYCWEFVLGVVLNIVKILRECVMLLGFNVSRFSIAFGTLIACLGCSD